jgi:hypothetical protein
VLPVEPKPPRWLVVDEAAAESVVVLRPLLL